MANENYSNHNTKPDKQRALVLQGGGALGAYEAGVIKILCNKLSEEDKENKREGRLLFDIVAGTSIGAMNGAILVSQFLETDSWEKAAEKLEKFWVHQLSIKCMDISEISKPWYDQWIKRVPTAASEEAARRYYSVKKLLLNQVRNNMYYQCDPIIEDNKFFDHSLLTEWPLHSTKPLEESIQKYARFPISTNFQDKKPRLLVFSVDVAEGMTVTFDSYPKPDGSRRSEYGNYVKEEERYENVIKYNDGIRIDHVMASGTLPEFYYYARVPTMEQKDKDIRCVTDKSKDNNIRYFWDGGLLSNTPLRELLEAHQQYWSEKGKIPDLDVYIVNVNPQKMDIQMLPDDHDGVKDRNNDIIFGDRTSHYDEKMAHLIADYTNLGTQMADLVAEAMSQVNDKNKKQELDEKLEDILATQTISTDSKNQVRKYEDLIRGGAFNLTIAMRIERINYINSIYGKVGDLTLETITKLIKEGKCDAWFSIIQKEITDMELTDTDKNILIKTLNGAMYSFRKSDYEDNDSQTYNMLTEFIKAAENIDRSKVHQSTKLVKSAEALIAILD